VDLRVHKAVCHLINTIREEVPVLKEAVTVEAEEAQEEVTEVDIWADLVAISNTLRDHPNNQVLSQVNTTLNSNNKFLLNSLEWLLSAALTQLWACLSNHSTKHHLFSCFLFLRLTYLSSRQSLIPMRRSSSLVTPCILISNKLSEVYLQARSRVC
jgi:hypothetical protein